MMPRVAIIYICHGTVQYVPEVVAAIAKLQYPKDCLTLIFIPNGSSDNVVEVIERDVIPRSGKDLPEIKLLNDGINHGFGKGNNLGIRWALNQEFDYVFLHNGDLRLAPESITKLVELAQHDPRVGSVQCLIRYWPQPEKVNVSGGMVHIAGYGYARDNGRLMSEVAVKDGEEITYASGAAVLYRAAALREVGLLEEGFFMYHEDLELGLRLRLAGYKNLLATQASAFHDYHFSRNPKKFAWMELYRMIVILSYFRYRTLIIFAPLILAINCGSWLMAIRGGWFRAKVWASAQWFKPSSWNLLCAMRCRVQKLRKISDQELLRFFTGRIEYQETENSLLQKFANPLMDRLFKVLRAGVRW